MWHSVQYFLRPVLFWDVTQCRIIVSCQHFKTNYPHLQGSSTSWTALPLKMGPIGCLKMSEWNYHSMMHKISNEHRSNVHRSGSLKSIFLWWTHTQLNMIFALPFWWKPQYTTVHHVMIRLERPNIFYTIKKTGHLETKLFCLDWCVPILMKRKFL
jgi:hypothetical protein